MVPPVYFDPLLEFLKENINDLIAGQTLALCIGGHKLRFIKTSANSGKLYDFNKEQKKYIYDYSVINDKLDYENEDHGQPLSKSLKHRKKF